MVYSYNFISQIPWIFPFHCVVYYDGDDDESDDGDGDGDDADDVHRDRNRSLELPKDQTESSLR